MDRGQNLHHSPGQELDWLHFATFVDIVTFCVSGLGPNWPSLAKSEFRIVFRQKHLQFLRHRRIRIVQNFRIHPNRAKEWIVTETCPVLVPSSCFHRPEFKLSNKECLVGVTTCFIN